MLRAAAGYSGLPLPQIPDFACELDILNELTANVVLGRSTLLGTGLLELIVIVNAGQYVPEVDGDGADLWPDLDPETHKKCRKQMALHQLCFLLAKLAKAELLA